MHMGHRLTYIQCMLGSRVRGSPCIDVYRTWTSIHLVHVRIPGKGITMYRLAYIQFMLGFRVRGLPCIDVYGALTSIHLVYVRIPGKGITMYRLGYTQCMLESRVRGSLCIDTYGVMMISVKLVLAMSQAKIVVADLMES